MFDCPRAAVFREFIVQVSPPLDPSEEGDQAHDSKHTNEYSEADVNDPKDATPPSVLFAFLFDLLCFQDLHTGLQSANHRPTSLIRALQSHMAFTNCICPIRGGNCGIEYLLVPNGEVEIKTTCDDSDNGETETDQVKVVDAGHNQLEEAKRKARN